MKLPLPAVSDIETLLATAAPQRILQMGTNLLPSIKDYHTVQAALGSDVTAEAIEVSDWESNLALQKPCDLVIISNVLEIISKRDGMRLLAFVRDRLSSQYCVFYQWSEAKSEAKSEHSWELADFLSLGLVRVNEYVFDDKQAALFKYSISSYKRTPDWLNPNNWANPELWGKYWW